MALPPSTKGPEMSSVPPPTTSPVVLKHKEGETISANAKVLGGLAVVLLILLAIAIVSYRSGSTLVTFGSVVAVAFVAVASWLVQRDASARIRTRLALEHSESVLRDFLDNASDMIQMISPEGKILYVNRAWRQKLGYSEEEIARLNLVDILHADCRDHCVAIFQRVLAGEALREVPATFVARDGRSISVEGNVNCRFEDGKPVQTRAIFRDVTERLRHERELRQTHEKLTRSMADLEQRNLDITRLSEMGELLQSCQAPAEAYQLVAQTLPKLFPMTVGAMYAISSSGNVVESVTVWGGAMPGETVFGLEECWALRRGRMHAVAQVEYGQRCAHVTASNVSGYLCIPLMAQGEALGILHLRTVNQESPVHRNPSLLFTDSGKRLATALAEQIALALANLRLRETLREQSIRDPLTGLFNRRYLEESLEREIRRATRSQRPLSVLMIDLDHFKRFNDTFGHDAGDFLLRELGQLLQANVRGSDIACRYGGEEFSLIMPDATPATAEERAEHIRKSVKSLEAKHAGQVLGAVTLSVGVAAFPEHGDTPFLLIRAADQALYRAKAAGRDRVMLAETVTDATPPST